METLKQYFVMMREDFPLILSAALSVIGAITILIVGFILARAVQRAVRNSARGSSRIDATLRPVLASTLSYIIIAMTLYAFLTKLGVPSTSLLAIFGAAGLAIGLALKDTLSNIASGVMMLTLRPLQVGEVVDTPYASGTVIEIGLFATTIKNLDGIFLFIPNGQMWHARVTNFARHTERRLTVDIGVGYETDLSRAQEILLAVMNDNPRVLREPALPECLVMEFEDSSIRLSCRCWMPADAWQNSASELRVAIKSALDAANIDIPYPQRVVISKPQNL